jgi:hypothetical protein
MPKQNEVEGKRITSSGEGIEGRGLPRPFFVSIDSKGFEVAYFVSMDSKGLRIEFCKSADSAGLSELEAILHR